MIIDLSKKKEYVNIFNSNLNCFYINNAGNKELLDTICDIDLRYNYSFWKSYQKILDFVKQILEGLKFLHNIQICHLDIKPENIMVDTSKFTFKIIDFGFSSKEPFTNYLKDIKGTPGYFPKNIPGYPDESYLPKIDANDCIEENGITPLKKDYKLVYGVDSFCFGRVLNFLKYIYDVNYVSICFNYEKNKGNKIDSIIKDLVEPNCFKRILIKDCYQKYFNS